MAKNLVAGETTKITESGSNISVELTDTMKNKINSIPSITIGTTTTGEAGTDASVSNSGTSTNMVLNFTIPKGANGQNGTDGQDGVDGTSVLVIEATDENNALTLSSQNPNNIYFWEE